MHTITVHPCTGHLKYSVLPTLRYTFSRVTAVSCGCVVRRVRAVTVCCLHLNTERPLLRDQVNISKRAMKMSERLVTNGNELWDLRRVWGSGEVRASFGKWRKLTSHYSHARGSRIQKRVEVRAWERGDRRRGLLSRRKVWEDRSPALWRQSPRKRKGRGQGVKSSGGQVGEKFGTAIKRLE